MSYDQDEKARRKEMSSWESALNADPSPISTLEAIEDAMADILANRFGSQALCDHFLKTMLPKYLNILMKKNDLDEEVAPRVNRFLQSVLSFLIQYIPYDIPEVLLAIAKVFANMGHHVFYNKYGNDGGRSIYEGGSSDEEDEEDEDETEFPFAILRSRSWDSRYFVENVNHFGRQGGFNKILERLRAVRERRLPLRLMKLLLKPLSKFRDCLRTRFLEEFVPELKPYTLDYILGLTDEELKNEDKKAISDIGELIGGLLRRLDYETADQAMDQFNLAVALKCFRSPYLEKRLAGLNDLKELIALVSRRDEYYRAQTAAGQAATQHPRPWLTAQVLLRSLKEERVMEALFTSNLHPELLRRCIEIPKFFAAEKGLEQAHLDMIWEAAQGKHESIAHNVYSLVADLAYYLVPEQNDYLYAKIAAIPPAEYDHQTLVMVRTFTFNSISIAMFYRQMDKLYGLDLLWEFAMDKSPLQGDLPQAALNSLFEFIAWPHGHYNPLLVERALRNLRTHSSVPQSLRLLQRVIETHPVKRKKGEHHVVTRRAFVEQLEMEHSLLDLLVSDLVHYKDAATKAARAAAISPADVAKTVLVGRHTHLEHIHQRLEFLEFVLGCNVNMQLTTQQLDVLWDSLVAHPLSPDDPNVAFDWLSRAKPWPASASPTSATSSSSTLSPAGPASGGLQDELVVHVFTTLLPKLDVSSLTYRGFAFFDKYFRYVNQLEQRLDQPLDPTVSDEAAASFVVLSPDLQGIDTLWRIALEARDSAVGKAAVGLLCRLHKNEAPELRPQQRQQREKYLSTIMTRLAEASAAATERGLTPALELVLSRCLVLLRTFLDEFEPKTGVRRHGGAAKGDPLTLTVAVVGTGKDQQKFQLALQTTDTVGTLREKVGERLCLPPSQLRIITAGKDLKADTQTLADVKLQDGHTVHITRRMTPSANSTGQAASKPAVPVEDDTVAPSRLLSHPAYFAQLFQLLTLADHVGQQAWDLILLLPTNQQLLHQLRMLPAMDRVPWDDLLDPRSTFKLYYQLQIVESLAVPCAADAQAATAANHPPALLSEAERREWCEAFVVKGGLRHLVQVLHTQDFTDRAKGSKRKLCLGLLLKLLNFFLVEGQPVAASLDGAGVPPSVPRLRPAVVAAAGVRVSELQAKLLELTYKLSQLEGAEPEDGEIVRQALSQFVAATLSAPEHLALVFQPQFLDEWLRAVLWRAREKTVRQAAGSALYALCVGAGSTAGPAMDGHAGGGPVENTVAGHVLGKLWQQLGQVQPGMATCEQYFEVFNRLVRDACVAGHTAAFHPLLVQLMARVRGHPVVEQRGGTDVDYVLLGLLALLTTLVHVDPAFAEEAGSPAGGDMVHEVFHRCLFDIPTIDNHGPYAPPKCKRKDTRQAGFRLLLELCRHSRPNFQAVSGMLLRQHLPPAEERSLWHYQPAAYERSECGFVGMKNLGATCYMNSLMQQFYMVPQFRYNILSVNEYRPEASASSSSVTVEGSDKREHLLYQLQVIFGHLQESEKKFYDPRPFCAAYKYDGKPLNPLVQQDADEFFNMLFDKLETSLKGTRYSSICKSFFGGTMVNQIISRECSHIAEREEDFFTLSIEVKGKKNILESLDLYVEGDMLEGDNKYMCGVCNTKVDALKRSCIQRLPNTLIIHLKRFEFDLELMKRTKVNDYCEFPMTIDMEPYTKEGLARKEAAAKGETPPPLPHPREYYTYELVGVLVHTGTADSGHYYSFIRERQPPRRWFSFNDMLVETFDERELQRACFGGTETTSQWDALQGKHVARSVPKPNSAYMLFYERVKQDLPEAVLSPALPPSQYVPKDIYEEVWRDNERFFHDKNIFDPDYFAFMLEFLKFAIPASPQYCMTYGQPAVPFTERAAGDGCAAFDPVFQTLELGTRFVLETLVHAKEKQLLPEFVGLLKAGYSGHVPASLWLLHHMTTDLRWPRQLLLQCTIPDTRDQFAGLLTHVLAVVAPYERDRYLQEEPAGSAADGEAMDVTPTTTATAAEVAVVDRADEELFLLKRPAGRPVTYIARFVDALFLLLKEARSNWRQFAHYFAVYRDVAQQGPAERQLLLSRQTVAVFIDFYLGEESPYWRYKKKTKRLTKMGDKVAPPDLSYMVGAVSLLVRSCRTDSPRISPTAVLPDAERHVLAPKDAELVRDRAFYAKALRDQLAVKPLTELAIHLAFEDERFSRDLVQVVVDGIHAVDYDLFKPFFELLSPVLALRDSLHAARVEQCLAGLVKVIMQNTKYRNATLYAVRYLSELSHENSTAREWLFEHRSMWVEAWLMGVPHDQVREATEYLVKTLAPGWYTPPSPAAPPAVDESAAVPMAVEPATTTTPSKERLLQLFEYLLTLLPVAKKYIRGEVLSAAAVGPAGSSAGGKADDTAGGGLWRLTGYCRLLSWSGVGGSAKAIFSKYFADWLTLYIQLDSLHYETDENKKELMAFWLQMCTDYPPNVRLITKNEQAISHMFDFFISLKSIDKFIVYNQQALPPFYKLLLLCAKDSEAFKEKMAAHTNFRWAVRHLALESAEYHTVTPTLFQLVELAVPSPDFRRHVLLLALSIDKLATNARNFLRLYDLVLQTPQECLLFAEKNGLVSLTNFIEAKHDVSSTPRRPSAGLDPVAQAVEGAREEEQLSLLLLALKVAAKVLKAVADDVQSAALTDVAAAYSRLGGSEWYQRWDNKVGLVVTLLTFLDSHVHHPQLFSLTTVALGALAVADSALCLDQLLSFLAQDHDALHATLYAQHSDLLPAVATTILATVSATPSVSHHLQLIANGLWGHPSSARLEDDPFRVEYYDLAHKVVVQALTHASRAPREAAEEKIQRTLDFGIMLAIETVTLPQLHAVVASILLKVWTAPTSMADQFKLNPRLALYVYHVLSTNLGSLDVPECFSLLRTIFPTVAKQFSEAEQSLLLEVVGESIFKAFSVLAAPSANPEGLAQAVVALIWAFKALTVLGTVEELARHFVESSKPQLLSLFQYLSSEQAAALRLIPRFDELKQLVSGFAAAWLG